MSDLNQKIGDYLILEKLAQGGMAQVFKAKTVDPSGIERLVVIKRILPHISSDPDYVDMLIDEAKIAVHFTHGNIAQIYDLGKVHDDYFIVMEYVDGKTLGQVMRQLRSYQDLIPIDIAVYCLIELCQGLDYMHRKKDPQGRPLEVVHRDISPQNIIISYSGTVKIIDFGVAKASEKLSQTQSGVLKGKFAYMSPEQASGKILDSRSDIFSAGTILWELLTQKRLFKKDKNADTVKAVRKAHVFFPSEIRPEIPKFLDHIVLKALNKRRGGRYPSAITMAEDLRKFLRDYNPDFRALQVVQFLYDYFGPEKDETNLPSEHPELNVQKKEPTKITQPQKETLPEEDILETIIDTKKEFIPRVLKQTWFWVFIVTLGLLGGLGYFIYQHWPKTIYYQPQAKLTMTVIPEDAVVFIEDHLIKKMGSSYELKLPANQGFHLVVLKDDFKPFESAISLIEGENKKLTIQLEKKVPPFGGIEVVTNPSGATVYLNDMEWNNKTPLQMNHLKSETSYRVGVFLENYRFVEREIILKKGETKTLEINLELDYGMLEINSSPEAAHVMIEDQEVGQTPYVNHQIYPQKVFEFKVFLEGYEVMTQSVQLKPGEKKELSFQLKKVK